MIDHSKVIQDKGQQINMQVTPNTFQQSKNKRRLIVQNIKLNKQVNQVKQQIERLQEQQPIIDQAMIDSQIRPIIDEVALQEKLIKRLRGQIEHYKLERAKDNVEYIVREEDDLKIAKKLELKLIDQKNIYLAKKADKNAFLQKQVPYQEYEQQFLQSLTEVVHYNRQQAAKITEIQREIRKYHLLKKSSQATHQKPVSAGELSLLISQIEQKMQAKASLQRQWKPHFSQMDEEYVSLLQQLSLKKVELNELEREEKNWEARVSAIRQAEEVLSDRHRLEQVTVSLKLKKQIEDYIASEEEKKKKKVSDKQLMYEFMNKKVKDKDKEKQSQPGSNGPGAAPLLPGQKKAEDKVMETMHNDKNITKKIDKGSPKKTTKANQTSNTQLTIPPKSQNAIKLKRADSPLEKKPLPTEEKVTRLWELSNQSEAPIERGKISQKQVESSGGVLHLKEVSIATDKQECLISYNNRRQGFRSLASPVCFLYTNLLYLLRGYEYH